LGGLNQNPSQSNQGNLASASLKTLSEKTQRDKTFQGKKSTEQTTETTRKIILDKDHHPCSSRIGHLYLFQQKKHKNLVKRHVSRYKKTMQLKSEDLGTWIWIYLRKVKI